MYLFSCLNVNEISYAICSVALEIIGVLDVSTACLFLLNTLEHNSLDITKYRHICLPKNRCTSRKLHIIDLKPSRTFYICLFKIGDPKIVAILK